MTGLERLGISPKTWALLQRAEEKTALRRREIEEIALENAVKVLAAFQDHGVSEAHFASTNGYGYDDLGRDTLEAIYADVFGGEDALVRHNIVSGTHALALCLYGLLRPGDVLLSATGKPYDTLEEVIGLRGENNGSLRDFGISYRQVELCPDGSLDIPGVLACLDERVKVVWLQKSKGYAWRNSLSVAQMEQLVRAVKERYPHCLCVVDNCYGEFVEQKEPLAAGVDLMAGSLIKNPGGGLAQSGAYVVGRKELVEQASYRLTAPGIGKHVGASLGHNRELFQGLYLAPHTTSQALQTAVLAAAALEELGFAVHPTWQEERFCTIQAVRFGQPDLLIGFCQGIQAGSPVDAHVRPEPWAMPGYEHPVIMAAGTFVQGATSELSADGPVCEPYIAYLQGGLSFAHSKLALGCALEAMKA